MTIILHLLSKLKVTKRLSSGSFRLLTLLFLTTVLYHSQVFAQGNTITGVVTSGSDNLPIPGANVIIKGTTVGTITDIDGNFSISAAPTDILVFSFIGFNNEEITVGNQTKISVSLREDIAKLDEVVVIGYGVQKKKLVTGATAQVKGDELQKQNQTNALQAMQGRTSGVNITSSSGQPGEGMKVVIRGTGTIGNSAPIYIVDGIQVSDIKHINNSDIEAIDVLKDAASCAIYGSQGANGVIMVTTKQGKSGKSQITFDGYFGFQNRAKKVDLLNAKEYAMIMNEQHINSGGDKNKMPFNINNLPEYTSNGSADTDWLDEMFVKNAIAQNYSLGVSGGSETGVYSLSIGYTGQEGIVGGSDVSNYDRFNARINSENRLYSGRIKIGEHMTFANTNKNGIAVGDRWGNSLLGAISTTPLNPIYDDNGEYFDTNDKSIVDLNPDSPSYGMPVGYISTASNPYGNLMLNNQNKAVTQNFLADIYSEIELIKDLKLKTTLGINFSAYDYRKYDPIYHFAALSKNENSKVTQNFSKDLTWNIDNVLYYSKNLGEHKIDLMAGNSIRKYFKSKLEASQADLSFDDFEHAWISNTTNKESTEATGAPEDDWNYQMLSYFGRIQYNYQETYMFNVVVRADGSSKFATGNKWGYFPSFSAGWVMSNADFMAVTSSVLNFMKLRVSYGKNGNSNIEAYRYLPSVSFTNGLYPFGNVEGTSVNGSYPGKLSNPDLIWEESAQWDIGFDSRLLNSNLSVEFDWYRKETEGWLVQAPVPATAGAEAPYINGGSVVNQGVELNLSYRNNVGDLNYTISANGSYNKNVVGAIPTQDGVIHGQDNQLYNTAEEFYRAEEGYPIGYFWGYKTNGIFKSKAEITDYINTYGKTLQSDPKPGDVRFVDTYQDGVINSKDKTMIGDPNPDFMFGFALSLDYKAFDFSLAANGVAGNQIIQAYRNQTDYNGNYTSAILDRWSPVNPNGQMPRVTQENINWQPSDLYVHDGDYLRLSNVTLGFDVAKVHKMKNISQLRIYASIQNAYTFTKYSGMDPEVGYGIDKGTTDKFSSGIDFGFYPRPRTILFGLNVKF